MKPEKQIKHKGSRVSLISFLSTFKGNVQVSKRRGGGQWGGDMKLG